MDLRNFKTVQDRRKALEKALRISLKNIGSFSLDERHASTKNCENMIGIAQTPLGIAGPLKVQSPLRLRSGQAKSPSTPLRAGKVQSYYIPLATTEGALVASVNRGCKAITLSGGVGVFVENIGATRAPAFNVKGIREALKFKKWVKENFSLLKKEAEKTSSHLSLKDVQTFFIGRNIFCRFIFDTQEAMGMNMVTIAVSKMVQTIELKTGIKCVSLSSNLCVDKKPSWLNFVLGRGKKVWAECIFSKKIVKEVLKTTAKKIYNVWLNKCLLGSSLAGSLGFNAHFSNVISAVFLATGQDLAHVVEGSLGITTIEINDNGSLYVSVYLPDLMVGTIGGGTGLATQKEALEILGLANNKKGDAFKLAEVIGGAVLAGEISLLASLAEGSLAEAHKRLGR